MRGTEVQVCVVKIVPREEGETLPSRWSRDVWTVQKSSRRKVVETLVQKVGD